MRAMLACYICCLASRCPAHIFVMQLGPRCSSFAYYMEAFVSEPWPKLMINISGGHVAGQGDTSGIPELAAGSEAEGEVRVQNADGSVEVQPEEELWDATSSSDVSLTADAAHHLP